MLEGVGVAADDIVYTISLSPPTIPPPDDVEDAIVLPNETATPTVEVDSKSSNTIPLTVQLGI